MKTALRLLGVLSLATLNFVGCHELGHVDGLGDYGGFGSSDVVGEVDYVDTRAREIEVRTDSGACRSSATTIKLKSLPAAQLFRRQFGTRDYIAAQTQQDRDGRMYADSITVRESVQDRGDKRGGNRLDRTEGRVEYVDQRRGTFELRDQRNRLIIVSIMQRAAPSDRSV